MSAAATPTPNASFVRRLLSRPLAVVADTATLGTLPDRELASGISEIIKWVPLLGQES